MTEKTKDDKMLDSLQDDMMDTENEIIDGLETVINSKWNAPILQKDLEEKIKTYRKLMMEFSDLYDQIEARKKQSDVKK